MEKQKELDKIEEEAEYLETVNNIQWIIYPFFKLIESFIEKTCGCCKNERGRIPHPDAKNKPENHARTMHMK